MNWKIIYPLDYRKRYAHGRLEKLKELARNRRMFWGDLILCQPPAMFHLADICVIIIVDAIVVSRVEVLPEWYY
jgi:hypothetical protein